MDGMSFTFMDKLQRKVGKNRYHRKTLGVSKDFRSLLESQLLRGREYFTKFHDTLQHFSLPQRNRGMPSPFFNCSTMPRSRWKMKFETQLTKSGEAFKQACHLEDSQEQNSTHMRHRTITRYRPHTIPKMISVNYQNQHPLNHDSTKNLFICKPKHCWIDDLAIILIR